MIEIVCIVGSLASILFLIIWLYNVLKRKIHHIKFKNVFFRKYPIKHIFPRENGGVKTSPYGTDKNRRQSSIRCGRHGAQPGSITLLLPIFTPSSITTYAIGVQASSLDPFRPCQSVPV